MKASPRFRTLAFFFLCAGIAFTVALGAPAVEDDETPAAEAPAADAPPAETSTKPRPRTTPTGSTGGVDAQIKAMGARLEKQGKELAALKSENVRLSEQIKLLSSIVTKLAALQQGK